MTITLDWWLYGLMSVKETQVPISARTVTGSTPMSLAIRSATGVTIDAVAALVTRFVITVVAAASTTTRPSVPSERSEIASAMTPASPLSTTIAPRPIEPASRPSTFGSSARTADRGVMTPVSTISTAPPEAAISAGDQAERRGDDHAQKDAERHERLRRLGRTARRGLPERHGGGARHRLLAPRRR